MGRTEGLLAVDECQKCLDRTEGLLAVDECQICLDRTEGLLAVDECQKCLDRADEFQALGEAPQPPHLVACPWHAAPLRCARCGPPTEHTCSCAACRGHFLLPTPLRGCLDRGLNTEGAQMQKQHRCKQLTAHSIQAQQRAANGRQRATLPCDPLRNTTVGTAMHHRNLPVRAHSAMLRRAPGSQTHESGSGPSSSTLRHGSCQQAQAPCVASADICRLARWGTAEPSRTYQTAEWASSSTTSPCHLVQPWPPPVWQPVEAYAQQAQHVGPECLGVGEGDALQQVPVCCRVATPAGRAGRAPTVAATVSAALQGIEWWAGSTPFTSDPCPPQLLPGGIAPPALHEAGSIGGGHAIGCGHPCRRWAQHLCSTQRDTSRLKVVHPSKPIQGRVCHSDRVTPAVLARHTARQQAMRPPASQPSYAAANSSLCSVKGWSGRSTALESRRHTWAQCEEQSQMHFRWLAQRTCPAAAHRAGKLPLPRTCGGGAPRHPLSASSRACRITKASCAFSWQSSRRSSVTPGSGPTPPPTAAAPWASMAAQTDDQIASVARAAPPTRLHAHRHLAATLPPPTQLAPHPRRQDGLAALRVLTSSYSCHHHFCSTV